MSGGYFHKIRIGVVLIYRNDQDDPREKLLLVRQNNRPFWVFPGGTLEVDEGLFECAAREMLEEVNLTVRIEKILYLADFMHEKGGQPRHTLDAFVLARHESGVPAMTPHENLNEMKFFTLEETRALVARNALQPAVAAERLLIDWPAQFRNAGGLYLGKSGTTL